MEGGIEGHDLRNARKDGLHGMDTQEVRRIVERGEIAAEGDLLEYVVIDKDGTGEEVASLDDTVTDCLDILEG